MHIQIVNFHLKGLSDGEFRAKCDEIAPLYAELPGLISKVWLANRGTNTYGGVYTWESRAAMEAFAESELFRAVALERGVRRHHLQRLRRARGSDTGDARARAGAGLTTSQSSRRILRQKVLR